MLSWIDIALIRVIRIFMDICLYIRSNVKKKEEEKEEKEIIE